MSVAISREPGGLTPAETPSLLNIIAQVAMDPAADVERLRILMEMQKSIIDDERRITFDRAMALAQSEMLPVARDAQNNHTKSKYARLETIDAAIRPIYTRNGFSLSFNQVAGPQAVNVCCRVAHTAGHSADYVLGAGLDGAGKDGNSNKTPIQALGSSVSYLRRYLTCMIFNITLTNEDNDGNARQQAPIAISETMKETLIALLQETNADTKRFLNYMEVSSIDQITRADYPRAIAQLQRKKTQQAEQATAP